MNSSQASYPSQAPRPVTRLLATLTENEIDMVAGGANCYTQTCVTTRDGTIVRCSAAQNDPCK